MIGEAKDLTMIVRGEAYIATLKTSQTIPTIKDLFFVPCNASNATRTIAAKKIISTTSHISTFFCRRRHC